MKFGILTILLSFPLFSCIPTDYQKEATYSQETERLGTNKVVEDIKNTNILVQDSVVENKVYKKIMELTEMKNYFKRVDSLFKGNKKATVLISSTPSKEEPFYWVQVGINDGDRIVPEYNFYVYPNNMEVKFYDAINDEILTLNQWRNKNKKTEKK